MRTPQPQPGAAPGTSARARKAPSLPALQGPVPPGAFHPIPVAHKDVAQLGAEKLSRSASPRGYASCEEAAASKQGGGRGSDDVIGSGGSGGGMALNTGHWSVVVQEETTAGGATTCRLVFGFLGAVTVLQSYTAATATKS